MSGFGSGDLFHLCLYMLRNTLFKAGKWQWSLFTADFMKQPLFSVAEWSQWPASSGSSENLGISPEPWVKKQSKAFIVKPTGICHIRIYIYIHQEILSELVHQQKTNGSLAMTMVQSLLKKRAFASNLLGVKPGLNKQQRTDANSNS